MDEHLTPAGAPRARLRYRPTRASDLPECIRLLPSWIGLGSRALAALPIETRPVFFGLTREQARASLPSTSVRHAFEHSPPRSTPLDQRRQSPNDCRSPP